MLWINGFEKALEGFLFGPGCLTKNVLISNVLLTFTVVYTTQIAMTMILTGPVWLSPVPYPDRTSESSDFLKPQLQALRYQESPKF